MDRGAWPAIVHRVAKKLVMTACTPCHKLQRTVWKFLKKLKIELLRGPAIPLLGIYPEKTIIQKDIYTPVFIAVLFTITRTWK